MLVVASLVTSLVALAPLSAADATVTTPTPDEPTSAEGVPAAQPVRLVVSALQAVVGPPDQPEELPEGLEAPLPPPDVTARLLVENRTDEPLVDTRLVVELEAPVTDRAALHARLDGPTGRPTGTTVLADRPIPTIAPGGIAQVGLELPGSEWAFTPRGVADAPDSWIRPMTIAVVRGASVLDTARTAVVGVSDTSGPPLEAAVVLPVATEPGPTPVAPTPPADDEEAAEDEEEGDAPPVQPVDEELLRGGRVDRLTRAIEAVPSGTIAVAPAAHTLEALDAARSRADGAGELLDRLRTIARADPDGLVSTPFALASVPVLAADDDTAPLGARANADGRRRLGRAIGAAPGATHLTVSPQTPDSLGLAPVDLLVSRWDDAAGVDLEADPTALLPPAVRTARTPRETELQVLVADPWAEEVLAGASPRHGYALDAHRVVLETAALWGAQPEEAGRVVAIVPPVGWDAPGDLATELTTRLAAAPWLRLAAPATVAQRASSTGTGWVPTPTPPPDLLGLLPTLGAVSARLEAVESAVPDGAPDPVPGRRDDLLRAVTAWPTRLPALRAQALLASVDGDLEEVLGTTVVPDDTTVTLASERGVVPVTLRREAGPTIDVLVEVRPGGRLVIEGEPVRLVTLEEGSTATIGFDARALGTGTFAVSVSVDTPDGGEDLATGLIPVRATAVSTPALAGIGVVVLLLLLLGRRRRTDDDRDRPRLEVVR